MREEQTKRSDDVYEDRYRHPVHPQRLHGAIVAVILENGRIGAARAFARAQLDSVICQVSNFKECRGQEERQEEQRQPAENELHVELGHWQAILPCQQRAA
jgi:hypothetical protein